MERLRQVIRKGTRPVAAVIASTAALSGCTGSATPTGTSTVLTQPQHLVEKMTQWATKPQEPATQLFCFWQRELNYLPDPAREGQMAPGLAGQLFLLDGQSRPATVTGDVTVAVYDATPRPAGMPSQTPEVWHFTRETVERMGATDERFGRSYVLFLPWPASWKDVTTVRVLTRYDPQGGTSLHAGEVKLSISLNGNAAAGSVWQKKEETAPAGLIVPAGAKILQQVSQQ